MAKRILKTTTAKDLFLEMEGILCVTQNHATKKDFETFLKNKNDNYNVDREKDGYELWLNKELIGYCDFSISKETPLQYGSEFCSDEELEEFIDENKHTLFVSTNLEIVYLLEKYRGMGIGDFFCNVIRDELDSKIIEFVTFPSRNFKCEKIEINASAEYYSEKGEDFHLGIHDNIKDYLSNILKSNHNVEIKLYIDACF